MLTFLGTQKVKLKKFFDIISDYKSTTDDHAATLIRGGNNIDLTRAIMLN